MIQERIDDFVRRDAEFIDRLEARDFTSAIEAVHAAAEVQRKLQWTLASNASAVESEPLRRFVAGDFQVQTYIGQLGLAADGPDGTPEWERLGYSADPHLNQIIDSRDPDWPEPINARLLRIAVLVTQSQLPDWVLRHLRSLRQCCAFELYDMVWVSLRALIEAASFARLKAAGEVQDDLRYMAEHSVRACLRQVEVLGDVPRSQIARIHQIIDRANMVVHARETLSLHRKKRHSKLWRLSSSLCPPCFGTDPDGC